MDRMDRSDIEDEGAATSAGSDSPDSGKAGISSPGSLMSVKIRKRTAGSTGSAARVPPAPFVAPPPESPSNPEPTEPTVPALDPDPVPDAISRVTRRAQQSQAARPPLPPRVPTAPPTQPWIAPTRARAEPRLEDSSASTAPARNTDIVAYWGRLRGGRRYPKSTEIDAATVADCWPNSILIRCRPGSRALEPEKIFVGGEGVSPRLSGLRGGGRVNLSPMMLQWLLGLAGEVVREGRPMNDVETFPSVKRVVHYRAVALPFSDNENAVDHVLCHFRPDA